MKQEIKIGTISWIEGSPNPMTWAPKAAVLEPDWIPKTYLGLAATANSQPSPLLADFLTHQKTKNFRALTYCHIEVEIDDKTDRIANFKVIDAIHDPGWTPPFKMWKWPSTAFTFDENIYSREYYPGEASPLSLVNTQARHKNSAIPTIPSTELVLTNSLIKFRAGKHTDDTGVNTVKAPFDVPWVWCEMLLTYNNGKLKIYGRGSVFPSHAWYLDGNRVFTQSEIGDSDFPKTPLRQIDVRQLRLYPVLSVGAPASGPQTSLGSELILKGSVETHPNTASGGALRISP